jgi:two-component system phosphate regulon sensor histidine kinase PhoR
MTPLPVSRDLLQRRTRELQILVRASQLVDELNLDKVLGRTLALAAELVGAHKGSFFLLDEQLRPVQRFITQRELSPEESRQIAQVVIDKGLAGWCIKNAKGALVSDIEQDPRWLRLPDDTQDDVKTALCVPVSTQKRVCGVMTLVGQTVGQFDEYHLELVEALAQQASNAVRNAQLLDAAQSHRQQLEILFQSHAEALLTVDAQLCITLINPLAQQVLGLPTDRSLLGESLESLLSDKTDFRILVEQIRQHQTHFSTFQIHDNSQDADYAVHISALLQEKSWQGYVIALYNITSVRQLERLRAYLIRSLSHDLLNPLNTILGYVDLIRIDQQQQTVPDERYTDGILRAVQRMENLIREILETEKLLSQGLSQPHKPIVTLELLTEALQSMQESIEQKQQTLISDYPTDLPEIRGVRGQLLNAMINLLHNANKYTLPGGTITVSARCEGGRFRFWVSDTGIGVPQELQGQLFSQFYRAYRPEIRNISGTGVGLSLVKKVVEDHHGQVWFESTPGVGSTFGFWLPLQSTDT